MFRKSSAMFVSLLLSCAPGFASDHGNHGAPAAAAVSAPAHEPAMHTQPAEAHGAATTHEESNGVDPEKALGWLKNGNSRFVKSAFRKDGRSKADVKRLSSGQKPHTIVLSCSDSRVPPEHVFDQGLGEIFVVRTAGQALGDNAIASIEYAVEHLGARLIVVMGHTSCGAVKAALGTKPGSSAGSPALDALVADIKPRLPSYATATKNVAVESSANAKGVAEELVKKSKILGESVHSGKIKIVSSLYDLETGKVEWLK